MYLYFEKEKFYRNTFIFSDLQNILNTRCEKTALASGYFGIYRVFTGLGKLLTYRNFKHSPVKIKLYLPIFRLES